MKSGFHVPYPKISLPTLLCTSCALPVFRSIDYFCDVVFWCPKSCFIELKLLLSSDVVWRITNRHLWLSFPLLSRKLYITDIPNLEECWNTFQCILSKRDAGTPKNYDLHNKRHYFIACMYVLCKWRSIRFLSWHHKIENL